MRLSGIVRNLKDIAREASIRLPEPTRNAIRQSLRNLGADIRNTLIVTVDVEASPSRQEKDHVSRLIWGRFGNHEVGIGRMMDIAEKHHVRLTFFVDFCETALYPGEFEEVCREILRRGHDVQIHAHRTRLPKDFFTSRGIPDAPPKLYQFSRDQAEILVRHALSEAVRCGVRAPVAFRGGGFEVGAEILRAMERHGLRLSFNYHCNHLRQNSAADWRPLFAWPDGIVEVPLGMLPSAKGWRVFDFNLFDFSDPAAVRRFLSEFFRRAGAHGVLAMCMHSFSFLAAAPETRWFEYAGERGAHVFEKFLSHLPEHVRVVTAADLDREIRSGNLRVVLREPYTILQRLGPAPKPAPATALAPAPAPKMAACNFCGTTREQMEDFGGRAKVRCPRCHSLERQRQFWEVYQRLIRREFDLRGKRVLHVAPSPSVRDALQNICQLVTADARPTGCDLQLDICRMPQIADGSFDAVIAKAVLQHCRDDRAALMEFRRILKPWGRVFLEFSCRVNQENESFSDTTAHYGKEALEKYGVGTFRHYGDRDALRLLQEFFLVKTFHGKDPVTDDAGIIFCGIRDPRADMMGGAS
jgi:SAM-dependent methyltransferase/peptidoglycan/xylan/chitin deacetylase (PgdA/CDA1 family)